MKTPIRREAPAGAEVTGDRTRRFVASDESVDRYNTVFKLDGWELDAYGANPVVLWCHDSRGLPVGKATTAKTGGKLVADVEFFSDDLHPDASRIMGMVDAGVLGISVGARVLESEYNLERESEDEWQNWAYPPLDFTRAELLELSIVTVPGNANALPMRTAELADLRLMTQAVAFRAAQTADQRPSPEAKALRAAALAKRAAAAQPPPAPQAQSTEELVELPEGLDADGLAKLVRDTVNEVVSEKAKAAELRNRGELEVSEGAAP
jgi:hypothetical protein